MDDRLHLLIADDDAPLATFIKKGLEGEGYAVEIAPDGPTALALVTKRRFDLVVLDLGLPGIDGTEVLTEVRKLHAGLPVLVLTARTRIEDRVKVLDAGADDYLLKPFSLFELSARLRAVLRRATARPETLLAYQDLELDPVTRTVRRGGVPIELTGREFTLLEYLMRNAGHRVTRSMIVRQVWKLSFDTMTNIVDVYVNYLRKKIEFGAHPRLIHTIRGVGYQFGEPPSPSDTSAAAMMETGAAG